MLRLIKNTPALPVTLYSGPHYQMSYQQCWKPSLNNPFLNKIYKDSICYTERWYLEIRKLILEEEWYHPLINSIVADSVLRQSLVKSTIIDGASMREILVSTAYPEFQISAGVNLKKINRWCAFFISLPDSLDTLVALNGQSPD